MSNTTPEARFAQLRELLVKEPKGQKLWALEDLFASWPEGDDKELAREYIDTHLEQWGMSSESFFNQEDEFEEPGFAFMLQGSRTFRSHTTRDARKDQKYGLQHQATWKKK